VGTARIALTQTEDLEHGIDQQHVFDRVALFLAAITARLLNRIRGALDASFGPVVAKRGRRVLGGTVDRSDVVGDSAVGSTLAAASASAMRRRWVDSIKGPGRGIPRARSVARSSIKRT
jgi:hypothetical protein